MADKRSGRFNQRPQTVEDFNAIGKGLMPELMGMEILSIAADLVTGRLTVRQETMAPNGFLHAGTVVTFADTCCGYGTVMALPEGAINFTTAEFKSNFFSSVTEGIILCEARPQHTGRTTQVWDADVTDEATGKKLAAFRCTQIVLYPK